MITRGFPFSSASKALQWNKIIMMGKIRWNAVIWNNRKVNLMRKLKKMVIKGQAEPLHALPDPLSPLIYISSAWSEQRLYLNTLFPSITSKLVLHQPSKGTNALFLGAAPSRKEAVSSGWEIIISFSQTIFLLFYFDRGVGFNSNKQEAPWGITFFLFFLLPSSLFYQLQHEVLVTWVLTTS